MSKADEVLARAQGPIAVIANRKMRATMSVQLAVLDTVECGLSRADWLTMAASSWDQIASAREKIEAKIAEAAGSVEDEIAERIEGAGEAPAFPFEELPPAAEGAVRVDMAGLLPVVVWAPPARLPKKIGVLCELVGIRRWRVHLLTGVASGNLVTTDVFEEVDQGALRPQNNAALAKIAGAAQDAPTPSP